MNKKAIAILGAIFLLIAGTLGFLIYTKYSSESSADTSPVVNQPGGSNNVLPPVGGNASNNATTTNTNQPPVSTSTPGGTGTVAGLAKVESLTTEPALFPALFFNGRGVSYFTADNQLYQADLEKYDGKFWLTRHRGLDIPVKSEIVKVLWPKAGGSFIVENVQDGKKMWSLFDSQKGVYVDLPGQIFSLDWMPAGDKIVYTWLENNKLTLNMSDPDGNNWVEQAEMWELDNILSVSPDGLNILYYRADNASSTNAINLTTPDGKVWKGLVKDGYNSGVLWSPDSKKFLFGKKDAGSQKYQIWHYDVLNDRPRNLGIFSTSDRSAWSLSSRLVYIAVSGENGEDNMIYRIDPESLEKKEYRLGKDVDAKGLFFSSTGDELFFTNRLNDSLYYLDLTQ